MTSQSSVYASADEASQSTSHISDTDPECTLLWEPNTVCGKGTADRYWLVENSRKCIDFCKNQLKVSMSMLFADSSHFKGPKGGILVCL
jgi:hypothetical protein